MENTAYVFLNGVMDSENLFYKEILKDKKNIFCADGGLKYALSVGVVPLEIWGDLDSVDKSLVEKAEKMGSRVIEFDSRKDFTDGELIISEMEKRGFEKIVVLGGLGGRTDHLLTNLNLLFKFKNVVFLSEKEKIFKVEKKMTIENEEGKTVSFIPMSDTVKEITLTGFEYPLDKYTVKRGESICTSNIVRKSCAVIEFKEGKLLGIIENK